MYRHESPYVYGGNNPINNIDVAGLNKVRVPDPPEIGGASGWGWGASGGGRHRGWGGGGGGGSGGGGGGGGGGSSLDNAREQADAYDADVYDYYSNFTYVPGVGSVNRNDVVQFEWKDISGRYNNTVGGFTYNEEDGSYYLNDAADVVMAWMPVDDAPIWDWMPVNESMSWLSAAKGTSDGNKYEYGSPESDIVTIISSSASLKNEYNAIKHSAELAWRLNQGSPWATSLYEPLQTWVNPKYLKYGKYFQYLGTAGDLLNLGGVGYNIIFVDQGFTFENSCDLTIAIVGFVPGYGDAAALVYMIVKPTVKYYVAHPEARDKVNYSLGMHRFCFVEGSKVTMGDGSKKNIEDIQIGDSVLTYNFGNKKLEINPVLKIDTPIHHKLIKIAFSNGEEITSTEDHPYYVKGKGVCSFNPKQTFKNYGILTKRVEIADFCFTIKKNRLKKLKVVQLMPIEMSVKTYNLSKIANSNNYFVNGVLVNNESGIK